MRYRLSDAILAASSVFFMQCVSFLEHQPQMQSRRGKDHAQTLFGLVQIPTMPQTRNILNNHCSKATIWRVMLSDSDPPLATDSS